MSARAGTRSLDGPIAALDVGSSKICCFIAVDDGEGVLRVVGIGHQVSRGVRSGAVVDMDEAEATIRSVVHAAEAMAGETVERVLLNLSGGYPAAHTLSVQVAIDGHEINEADEDGNVVINAEHVAFDTKDVLIQGHDRLIATVGLENLIIVDSGDAVLVCAKDKAQDVKKVVNWLEENGRADML